MSMNWKHFPVSMTELSMVMEWRKNPQGKAYNVTMLLPLPRGTDIERLRVALRRVLCAHTNLLSRFSMEADCDVVRMVPEGSAEDLPIRIDERLGAPVIDALIQPFSDPEGALCRFQIIRDGEKGLPVHGHPSHTDGRLLL